MSWVCFVYGLLCLPFVMSTVCYVFRLLCLGSVMSTDGLSMVCLSRVNYGTFDIVEILKTYYSDNDYFWLKLKIIYHGESSIRDLIISCYNCFLRLQNQSVYSNPWNMKNVFNIIMNHITSLNNKKQSTVLGKD